MTTMATTAGFQGSDTDALDKIASTMTQVADFTDTIIKALQLLCQALDAMSWTGYAAVLAAYLRGTVIPLLKAVSSNLRMFAKIVSFASMLQSATSANDKPIIDCGDTGFVPAAIESGTPTAQTAPGKPAVSVTAPPSIGAPSSTPTPEKLKTVAGDIAELAKDIEDFQKAVNGDQPTPTKLATALGKLGEIIIDVQKLSESLSGESKPAAETGTTPPMADPTVKPPATGTTPPTFDGQQIWNAVTGVLRELGILPPESTPAPSPQASPEVIKADIDAVQTHLDKLRSDLGLPPYVAPTDAPKFTASEATPTAPTTTATPEKYAAADTGLGSGGGTGGGTGGGSGGGSPSGGGSGGGAPAGEVPSYGANAAIPVSGSAQGIASPVGSPETRLVATAYETGGASPAIPISTAAVAASLLGGIFARKAANAAGGDGDSDIDTSV